MPFTPEHVKFDLDETVKLSKTPDGRYHLYLYGSDCKWHDVPIEPLRNEIIMYFFNHRAFPDGRTCRVRMLMTKLSGGKSLGSMMNAICEIRAICQRVGCMEIIRKYGKGLYGLNKELDCCVAVWKSDGTAP